MALAICSGVSAGRVANPAGLSLTSASSKFGGWGSGSFANAPMCRAAGFAVLLQRLWFGASGSGPPLWGARYASDKKNGRRSGARREISSTALSV